MKECQCLCEFAEYPSAPRKLFRVEIPEGETFSIRVGQILYSIGLQTAYASPKGGELESVLRVVRIDFKEPGPA